MVLRVIYRPDAALSAKPGGDLRSPGSTEKKATMPSGKAGSVTGDDLAAIKAWTDAWDAADNAGAHAPAADPTH
jgi:hypothetical protein